MFLGKPENLEELHPNTGRTWKLHSERSRPTWELNPNFLLRGECAQLCHRSAESSRVQRSAQLLISSTSLQHTTVDPTIQPQ